MNLMIKTACNITNIRNKCHQLLEVNPWFKLGSKLEVKK